MSKVKSTKEDYLKQNLQKSLASVSSFSTPDRSSPRQKFSKVPFSNEFLDKLKTALDSIQIDGDLPELANVYLIGNGGSSAIASHITNDLVKHGVSAHALNDAATLTCFANDYGYEHVYSAQILRHDGSVLVAISSSGHSINILSAVATAKDKGMKVVTLSGFAPDNPLRGKGDCNFYVPSYNYGIVECSHLAILHSIVNPG